MSTKQQKKSKGWNITLWIVQVLLAAMFLMVGGMKTVTPIEELSKAVPLAAQMPFLIRFIGISEVAGALGLILPSLLRILPQLTVWAAAALALVMVLALGFHLSRGEFEALPTNIVLGVLAGLVVFGRSSKAIVEPRVSHSRVGAAR